MWSGSTVADPLKQWGSSVAPRGDASAQGSGTHHGGVHSGRSREASPSSAVSRGHGAGPSSEPQLPRADGSVLQGGHSKVIVVTELGRRAGS